VTDRVEPRVETSPAAGPGGSWRAQTRHRLVAATAGALGIVAPAAVLSPFELWVNLTHDFFQPRCAEQAWAIFWFDLYGLLFLAALGPALLVAGLAMGGLQRRQPSRPQLLAYGLAGAVFYLLLHHSRHVLLYWESGGTW
jgi:hypothetical protein